MQEGKHSSGLQGLKRFGTVLSRRRQSSHPYGRASSPERKSSTNLGASFPGFGKGKSKERDAPSSSSGRPVSPARRLSTTPRASDASSSPRQTRQSSGDKPNGTTSPEPPIEAATSSSIINGTAQETIPELNEPLSPPPPSEPKPEVYRPITSSHEHLLMCNSQ